MKTTEISFRLSFYLICGIIDTYRKLAWKELYKMKGRKFYD